MVYYVYILQSLKDGSYYVGSTQDVASRLERHNQGRSLYTKTKRPWKLIYQEGHPDRSSAVKREIKIKGKKKRTYIDQLVRTSRP
ncbi:MAG: GIY-YIG nuclease family protein [Deltaproteobacteria bacterium]|nr:MAG: GIY-YIG nuclease family protein [Deltaproteobacteria bacterium]RLC14045.1 MAG: GIY-YIG nuclease family protein [Deltaproteobacteria bacterium]